MEGVPIIPGAWWVFEFIIFGVLIGFGALMVEVLAHASKHGRSWRHMAVFCFLFVSWGVVFWGSMIEVRLLTVEETTIPLTQGAQGEVRIAVVADTHVGPYKKARWIKKVVARLNALDVEAVLIPGDFVFHATEESEMLRPFSDLKHPAYAVMGNHDHQHADVDVIQEVLETAGMHILRNASEQIETSAGILTIAGIDDVWFTPNPVEALEDTQGPVIFLTHNPDFILDPYAQQTDLIIAGHTHCGQIRLPWVGPVPPLPTELGRAWDCGLFELEDDRHLFITPGVGETGPRARLFNPPQIDILTVQF